MTNRFTMLKCTEVLVKYGVNCQWLASVQVITRERDMWLSSGLNVGLLEELLADLRPFTLRPVLILHMW